MSLRDLWDQNKTKQNKSKHSCHQSFERREERGGGRVLEEIIAVKTSQIWQET